MNPNSTVAGLGILLFCLTGGCTSTKSGSIGQYATGDQPLIRHAPETAFYKVQWLSADRRELGTCAGTDRLVVRGEPVGFKTGPNGQVTAIAGIYQFPLQQLPGNARYCQWYYKVKRETHLGQNLDGAGEVVAGSALIGGVAEAGREYFIEKTGGDSDSFDHHSSHADGHRDRDHNITHVPASQKSE